jgi:hypothetical protein
VQTARVAIGGADREGCDRGCRPRGLRSGVQTARVAIAGGCAQRRSGVQTARVAIGGADREGCDRPGTQKPRSLGASRLFCLSGCRAVRGSLSSVAPYPPSGAKVARSTSERKRWKQCATITDRLAIHCGERGQPGRIDHRAMSDRLRTDHRWSSHRSPSDARSRAARSPRKSATITARQHGGACAHRTMCMVSHRSALAACSRTCGFQRSQRPPWPWYRWQLTPYS